MGGTTGGAPLADVRVLDLTAGPMRAVGGLLADLGAAVTPVELSGVTAPRAFGPAVDGVHLGAAVATRGVGATCVEPSADQWRAMLDDADLLIESTPPGSAAEAVLDVAGIRRDRPRLVVLSISDFGRGSRFAAWQATGPVLHALTGVLSRTGDPGREPFLPPGELPYDTAAAQAATHALAVLFDARRTGRGDRIDFSVLEGATATLDPAFGMAGSAAMGKALAALPRGRTDESHKYPILPCRDGHVRLCILARRQWRGLFEWMGRPEEFADPRLDMLHVRYATPTLLPAVARFFADKTRAEIEQAGQRHGVPTAAVLDAAEAIGSPQTLTRGFFRDAELAPGLVVPLPEGIAEIDGSRMTGPHEPAARPAVAAPTGPAPETPRLPLTGLRIVDLGVIIVGGDSARVLADLGAEVIKVENSAFPDGARASLPPGRMMAGFASGHRNKSSLGIDLSVPEGRDLVHRLVAGADIVMANFKPGTLAKLGVDRDALASVHPGVVIVESSAFGPTGPWAQRLGYGPLVRAATGFTDRWVYPDAPGRFQDDITAYPDHACARLSALLALALVIRRQRTGAGGSGSVAQAEVILSHLAPEFAADTLAGAGHTVAHPGRDTPWGVFPAAGDDEWVVVTGRDDRDWQALTAAIDRPDLHRDPRLADAAGRVAARDEIDAAVAAWTAARPASEAMELLQAAGVPAGAMLRGSELPSWEYSVVRRMYRPEDHAFAREPFLLEGVQIHAEHVAEPPARPAPMLGEHTREVAADLLGLTAEQIADLLARGVLECPPLPVSADLVERTAP